MEKQTAYKLHHEGSCSVVFSLTELTDLIVCEIESSYQKGDEPLKYSIEVCEMDEIEIENLPEFEGY